MKGCRGGDEIAATALVSLDSWLGIIRNRKKSAVAPIFQPSGFGEKFARCLLRQLIEQTMLTLSESTDSAFRTKARAEAIAALRLMLVGKNASLGHDATFPDRLNAMVQWAEDKGITLKYDITAMAEAMFVSRLDLFDDPDFRQLVNDPQQSREFIMLAYLERKPPTFWSPAK